MFSILLFIGRVHKIWSFVKEGVSDVDLPLAKITQHGTLQLSRSGEFGAPLRCLREVRDFDEFVTRQWRVLIPVLGDPVGEKLLHCATWKDHVRLPFLSWEDEGRTGGFGQVHKVKIHPDHHTFVEDEVNAIFPRCNILTCRVYDHFVAVKQVPGKYREIFDREANALQNLRKPKHAHPHLIKLLATYERQDFFHLILPWADLDLVRYWGQIGPTLSRNERLSRWVREQCCGITRAVSKIHHYDTMSGSSMMWDPPLSTPKTSESGSVPSQRMSGCGSFRMLFGRHGDINLANILWFPDLRSSQGHGVLKISDFGTVRFSKTDMISKEHSDTVAQSRSYQSPESRSRDAQLSSQCDVWALGCVFLEFVCWYLEVSSGVESFEQARASNFESSSFFTFRNDATNMPELKTPVLRVSVSPSSTTSNE